MYFLQKDICGVSASTVCTSLNLTKNQILRNEEMDVKVALKRGYQI